MDFKKLLPHLIAAGIMLAVAMFFFAPNAFSGKVLPQPDNDKARAMQRVPLRPSAAGRAARFTLS